MRWTQTLISTMKESPEGAEIPSHVLMLRAGLINQVMAGAYTYLPLGLRALRKAEQIVREEMDAAGAIELLMSALTPISLWEQTGRVEAFGDVLIQFSVRRQNRKVQMALGPTHEEIVTDLVSKLVNSYRQMPITLYQIQTKFRNEERPRFGVMRTSEFIMKDAYSFDTSVEALGRSYDKMYAAYCRIFERCGVEYLPVEAESGPIGGDASHEFMAPAENGEDTIVHCKACGYAANLEKAEIGARNTPPANFPAEELKKVDTPLTSTIEQVSKLLKVRPMRMIKTLIYVADGQPIAVLLRGDHEANENKVRRAAKATKLALADPSVIEQVTGAPVGFAGPVNMKQKIPIYADREIQAVTNAVVGANQADAHLTGVNRGRDFEVDHFADLRNAVDGDSCPRCNGTLAMRHAIEIGHVFKLGTKYSTALKANYLDAQEKLQTIIMGCYGIGINRIIASLIETTHDKDGIIWPVSLAPYEVLLAPVNVADPATQETADKLYQELLAAKVDVLLDDRDVRAGVKFKDADLLGLPLRVVISDRNLKQGKLELKWRWDAKPRWIDVVDAAQLISQLIGDERATGSRFHERDVLSSQPQSYFAGIFDAVRNGTIEDVKHFIEEKDANINEKNKAYDNTPLHAAILTITNKSDIEISKYLILKGAEPNAKNKYGNTPLHVVASHKPDFNIEVLKHLISQRVVDVNAKNNNGKTPLDLADTEEKKRILQEAGGKSGTEI